MTLNQIILLCRPGFEKECAGEIIELANRHQHNSYIQTSPQSGFVQLVSSDDKPLTGLFNHIDFNTLIFSRQWFATQHKLLSLPERDRLPDIVDAVLQICNKPDNNTNRQNFCHIEMSYADTNEGKALNKFCKQFKPHLLKELKQKKLLSDQAEWGLHFFFTDSQHVYIGIAPIHNQSAYVMGIPRLRMPSSAPSRSTLKLEEAIHWFLSPAQQTRLLRSGMTAVDLGAAPGGWSWQLVQRDCLVTAIDNGPMQEKLMRSGMVEHLQTDAFTYKPEKQVDWLVCDMAERPLHVSRLIARWLTEKHCKNAIFNLKLPMKKRLPCVQECLALFTEKLVQANIPHQIKAKQLYHDREEITVCVLTEE